MSVAVDPREARNPNEAGITEGASVGYREDTSRPWWAEGIYANEGTFGRDFSKQAIPLTIEECRNPFSVAEKIKMLFDVSIVPNLYSWQGKMFKANSRTVIREDNAAELAYVGGSYEVIPNSVGVGFANDLKHNGETLSVSSAGVLFDGKRLFVCQDLPDMMIAGDMHYAFITTVWSHDKTLPLVSLPVVTRAVCNNTVRRGLSEGKALSVRVRHSGDVLAKASEARRILSANLGLVEEYKQSLELLAAVDATPEHFDEFMKWLGTVSPAFAVKEEPKIVMPVGMETLDTSKWIKPERELVSVRRVRENREKVEANVKAESRTLYGMYQGLTAWTNHDKRSNDTSVDPVSKRFQDLMFGDSAKLNEEALTFLTKQASA